MVKMNLLTDKGKLKYVGWGKNLANHMVLNYDNVQVPGLPKSMNWLKMRAWNFYLIYTP